MGLLDQRFKKTASWQTAVVDGLDSDWSWPGRQQRGWEDLEPHAASFDVDDLQIRDGHLSTLEQFFGEGAVNLFQCAINSETLYVLT